MRDDKAVRALTKKIAATFAVHGVQLTLGGEPTYVPVNPEGPEWQITALGPTKLRYAYALAEALIAQAMPSAVVFYSPGKSYPGELNPRWSLKLIANRDGRPLVAALRKPTPAGASNVRNLRTFRTTLCTALGISNGWLRGADPVAEQNTIWILPLDHAGGRFVCADWKLGKKLQLLRSEGPAGLRLPLEHVPEGISRRALTLEVKDGQLEIFLPPLLQKAFLALLEKLAKALRAAELGPVRYSGYVPEDVGNRWEQLGIAADPGVLEINLPPCPAWEDYDRWLHTLQRAGETAGLRSFKGLAPGDQLGTGGGNHLLFGGPTLDTNPLFTHPRWVTSILRYWQQHPALSYLFTGQYVGSASQAPRPDESASALYDLELGYQFLESLPPGDHRGLLSETLRHLHTDSTGNTHRSETSFDKFWNVSFDGGCRGLIEFRACETLPRAEWMSAVALLWQTLAAWLLTKPITGKLTDHGERLHDAYFLPAWLWADLEKVLADLKRSGFVLPAKVFREIADWRFPVLLRHEPAGETGGLTVRRALESWPLLCEQPLEGGSTSRFVDTSMERLEFTADAGFAATHEVYVQGRRLALLEFPREQKGAGLRYRRTAWYPSLHPGLAPQMPLEVCVQRGSERTRYQLDLSPRSFQPGDPAGAMRRSKRPCQMLHPGLLTYDLRVS